MTEAEILEALEQALAEHQTGGDQPSAFSRREIQKRLGWGPKKTLEFVRGLIEDGLWECVMVPSTTITGKITKVPKYRPARRNETPQTD